MKNIFITIIFLTVTNLSFSQQTFPINGVADKRSINYAFTHAKIWVDYKTSINDATLLIRDGKVADAGTTVSVPADAVVYDMHGKSIYPSFIDAFTEYGMPETKRDENPPRGPQITSNTKGAFSWNQALKPEFQAYLNFAANPDKASQMRKSGFGTVLSLKRDGIARGTAVVTTLADDKENNTVLVEKAAACYSFDKGSSLQDYPNSEMGCIALLRQSFLDADWYRSGGKDKEYNISIEAWINNQSLPQLFETTDKLQAMRIDKVGDEFGVKYITVGSGNEYQRLDDIKATGNSFIIPLKFPEAYDVSEPYDALNISLEELKHWEMAPANPAILDKAGINIALTAFGLKDGDDFISLVHKCILYGLPEEDALKALTYTPATLLGISDKTGSLKKGMLANFIITSGDVFGKDNVLYENWVQGKRYIIRDSQAADIRGNYSLKAGANNNLKLLITGELNSLKAFVLEDTTKQKADISYNNNNITLRFELKKSSVNGNYVLNGYPVNGKNFRGNGQDSTSRSITWEATYLSAAAAEVKIDTTKETKPVLGTVTYPNKAYGFTQLPAKETVLIKNVTVWTNEKEGILKNTDVLISDGKIAAIGTNLPAGNAKVVDGSGKHLSAGIIDEHSHIAISQNVNECSHAVTSEVRIGDMLDPEDLNIYRQLAGGVTTSQLLHGSCNPIGGQSAIIKLRWGASAEKLKFEGADGFIKFALGENVKQSNWGDDFRVRYPQTRMGVEQVYMNAFSNAKEYEKAWKNYNDSKAKGSKPRRDLRLDALVEILNNKRFITCHSYEQSEINMLMHVADSMGFHINTFTHILEGYKVADKMKARNVGASSFSDWWAYKYEVMEAIPYNGAIMHDVGLIVAYNSDDAEMARRLNQEAAKAVKYGGVSEEEALKFVTLNPAKLLHIDNRVGSVKVGKDADVVLWSDNPLSIYAQVEKTFIDGICYYDATRDSLLRIENQNERERIITKMIAEKNKGGGGSMGKPSFRVNKIKGCMDDEDKSINNH